MIKERRITLFGKSLLLISQLSFLVHVISQFYLNLNLSLLYKQGDLVYIPLLPLGAECNIFFFFDKATSIQYPDCYLVFAAISLWLKFKAYAIKLDENVVYFILILNRQCWIVRNKC